MERTKLGITVSILASCMYFLPIFGGYTPTILLAGYILLVESNIWLRRVSVKALVVVIGFDLIYVAINLMPEILESVQEFLQIFDYDFEYQKVNLVIITLKNIIGLVKTVTLLCLGYKALRQEEVRVSFADRILNRHF